MAEKECNQLRNQLQEMRNTADELDKVGGHVVLDKRINHILVRQKK